MSSTAQQNHQNQKNKKRVLQGNIILFLTIMKGVQYLYIRNALRTIPNADEFIEDIRALIMTEYNVTSDNTEFDDPMNEDRLKLQFETFQGKYTQIDVNMMKEIKNVIIGLNGSVVNIFQNIISFSTKELCDSNYDIFREYYVKRYNSIAKPIEHKNDNVTFLSIYIILIFFLENETLDPSSIKLPTNDISEVLKFVETKLQYLTLPGVSVTSLKKAVANLVYIFFSVQYSNKPIYFYPDFQFNNDPYNLVLNNYDDYEYKNSKNAYPMYYFGKNQNFKTQINKYELRYSYPDTNQNDILLNRIKRENLRIDDTISNYPSRLTDENETFFLSSNDNFNEDIGLNIVHEKNERHIKYTNICGNPRMTYSVRNATGVYDQKELDTVLFEKPNFSSNYKISLIHFYNTTRGDNVDFLQSALMAKNKLYVVDIETTGATSANRRFNGMYQGRALQYCSKLFEEKSDTVKEINNVSAGTVGSTTDLNVTYTSDNSTERFEITNLSTEGLHKMIIIKTTNFENVQFQSNATPNPSYSLPIKDYKFRCKMGLYIPPSEIKSFRIQDGTVPIDPLNETNPSISLTITYAQQYTLSLANPSPFVFELYSNLKKNYGNFVNESTFYDDNVFYTYEYDTYSDRMKDILNKHDRVPIQPNTSTGVRSSIFEDIPQRWVGQKVIDHGQLATITGPGTTPGNFKIRSSDGTDENDVGYGRLDPTYPKQSKPLPADSNKKNYVLLENKYIPKPLFFEIFSIFPQTSGVNVNTPTYDGGLFLPKLRFRRYYEKKNKIYAMVSFSEDTCRQVKNNETISNKSERDIFTRKENNDMIYVLHINNLNGDILREFPCLLYNSDFNYEPQTEFVYLDEIDESIDLPETKKEWVLFKEGTDEKYEIGRDRTRNFVFEYRDDRWGYYAKDTHEEPYYFENNRKIIFQYDRSQGWGWYDEQKKLKTREDLKYHFEIPNVTPPSEPKLSIKPSPILQQDRQLLFLALLYSSDSMTSSSLLMSPSVGDPKFPAYYPAENKLILNGNSFFTKYGQLINNVIVDSLEEYKLDRFSRSIVHFLRTQNVPCENIISI